MPQPGDQEQVSLLDLSIVLAKRKSFILGTTFVVAVVTAIVSLILPSRYTAMTVILPPQNSTNSSSFLMAQLGNISPMASLAGSGFGAKSQNDLYIALIKSRTVETAIVKRFNLMERYHSKRLSDAIKDLESHSEVQTNTKDGLITISVTDRDAKMAADMANGFVDEYRGFSGSLAITEASQRRLFFDQQLALAKDNLGKSEEALKKTEQETGMFQLDSQARALIETAASLRAQIAAKEVEIHAMRSYASDDNPELKLQEQQLAGWKAQLTRLTGSQSGNDDDFLLSKGQVPGAGLEYVRRLRDVKYYETIFELLAKQFEMAKLDEARQGAIIQVVDPAIPPDRRSFPKRAIMVLGVSLAGFFVAVCWVIVTEALRNLLKNPTYKDRLEQLRDGLTTKPTFFRNNS